MLLGSAVEAFGQVGGDPFARAFREEPGQTGLLNDEGAADIAAEHGHRTRRAQRLTYDVGEVSACALAAVAQGQQGVFQPLHQQVFVQRRLVLEVGLRRALLGPEQGWLRDVQVTALDQLRHLPVEERQQQRADVGAVDVSVGHDYDLVVAQLLGVEFLLADPRTQRRDQRPDLLTAEHLVEARALDVEDLAAQRQDRLKLPVPALLGGPAGRVTLDEEQLGDIGVARLAVGELAGQRVDIQPPLLPRQFTRLTGGFAGGGGLTDLLHDAAGFLRVLFEPALEFFVHHALDHRPDFGGNQLILGLRGEFRVRHLDRQHTGQALARIVAGQRDLFLFRDPGLVGVAVDLPGQGTAEPGEVGAAVALRDVVGEAKRVFVEGVGPLHRHFDGDAVFAGGHQDRFGYQRLLRLIEVGDIGCEPALVKQVGFDRLFRALVGQDDAHPGIQERQLAQTRFEGVVAEIGLGKGVFGRPKANTGAALVAGNLTGHRQRVEGLAVGEGHLVLLAIAPDRQLQTG